MEFFMTFYLLQRMWYKDLSRVVFALVLSIPDRPAGAVA
jgi:hypothetical protein